MTTFINYIKMKWQIIKNFFEDCFAKPETYSKGIAQETHEINKKMVEDYFVPGHEPRNQSDVYRRSHDALIKYGDTPCFICGVKKSTLNDPAQNLYGSKQMELHHWIIEWSLANCTDFGKLKNVHPDFSDWDKVNVNDSTTFKYFVDSVYNAMILCDVHHRATYRGIHAIEYPIWLMQKFVKQEFKFINVSTKDMPVLLDDMS